MNIKLIDISLWTELILLPFLSVTACDKGNGCQDATTNLETSISQVCREPDFVNTPFCKCCVPNGFFAIDDTCTCKQLVLDADFCFYQDGEQGYPSVRNALVQAAGVCQNRQVTVPYLTGTIEFVCQGHATAEAAAPDAGSSPGQ